MPPQRKQTKGIHPLINAAITVLALGALGIAGFIIYQKKFATQEPEPALTPLEVPLQVFNWAPDPTLLAQLAPPVNLDGCQVRPPAGYERATPENEAPGVATTAWAGAKRSDGSYPSFQVSITTIPKGEPVPDAGRAIEAYLQWLSMKLSGFNPMPMEIGKIGRRSFGRARWSGAISESILVGFCYAATNGRKVILLVGQDVEPNHEQELRLAEAAALTIVLPAAPHEPPRPRPARTLE